MLFVPYGPYLLFDIPFLIFIFPFFIWKSNKSFTTCLQKIQIDDKGGYNNTGGGDYNLEGG